MQTGQSTSTGREIQFESSPAHSMPVDVLIALLSVQILFGLNYGASKTVLHFFHPIVWANLRVWITTALLFGMAIALRKAKPKLDRTYLLTAAGLSLLGVVFNQASFLLGLKYTTPTNSAVISTMIPVLTLMVVVVRGQEKATLLQWGGFLLAFSGVLILRKFEDFRLSSETFVGDLLSLANCLFYSLFLSFGKSFLEKWDRIWTTAYLFLFGSIGMTFLALPFWIQSGLPSTDTMPWGAMSFSIIGGTLLTYFLGNYALAKSKSSSVALFICIQPVIAVLAAWGFNGEIPEWRTFAASGLILLGMILAIQMGARSSRAGR